MKHLIGKIDLFKVSFEWFVYINGGYDFESLFGRLDSNEPVAQPTKKLTLVFF